MDVSDICIELATNFAKLAEELKTQQGQNEAKMECIEHQVKQNRDALKDVANAILSRFR